MGGEESRRESGWFEAPNAAGSGTTQPDCWLRIYYISASDIFTVVVWVLVPTENLRVNKLLGIMKVGRAHEEVTTAIHSKKRQILDEKYSNFEICMMPVSVCIFVFYISYIPNSIIVRDIHHY